MYKIYLKQAWQMLMQNRFISIIAILGTALAIMMILVIVMADTVQNADAAPESNRSRTLYIEFFAKRDTTRGALHMGTLPYSLVKEYLLNLKTPELVTFVNEARYDSRDYCIINRQGADNSFDAMTRMTNDAYWKLMNFSFVSGRPFSKEEYDAGQQVAVISQSRFTRIQRSYGRCLGTDHRTGGLHRKAADRNAPATGQRRLSGPAPGDRRSGTQVQPGEQALDTLPECTVLAPYPHDGCRQICL